MNRYCPRCGEPFEDDGDRIYTDSCLHCGWRTKERELADCVNEATLEFEPHCRMLGQHIYELQALYDQSCGYSSGQVAWADTTDGVRRNYTMIAAGVLVNRAQEMRHRLTACRARKRSKPPAPGRVEHQQQEEKHEHEEISSVLDHPEYEEE